MNKKGHLSSSSNRSSKEPRLPLEGIYAYLLAALIGYMGASLVVVNLRPQMLPQEAPPTRPKPPKRKKQISLANYKVITKRNIFNEDGVIPEALTNQEQGKSETVENVGGAATLTSLPLELKGTIVHRNPKRSVATIVPKGQSNAKVTSFRVKEEIDGIAKIISIQRRKVIFKNLNSGRKEYMEMPEDSKVSIGYKGSRPSSPSTNSEVTEVSPNEFTIKRADILKYTNNAAEVIRQARMMPYILPSSDGQVEGFRFVSIQPNSIYEKLGFKVGDIIKQVNGESINSPTKAMELYNALKTSSQIKINVERNGSREDNTYSIVD